MTKQSVLLLVVLLLAPVCEAQRGGRGGRSVGGGRGWGNGGRLVGPGRWYGGFGEHRFVTPQRYRAPLPRYSPGFGYRRYAPPVYRGYYPRYRSYFHRGSGWGAPYGWHDPFWYGEPYRDNYAPMYPGVQYRDQRVTAAADVFDDGRWHKFDEARSSPWR